MSQQETDKKILCSVVIPLFNEEGNLKELHERLSSVFKKNSFDYEIIFVDDGSSDGSLQVIRDIASSDSRTKYISFSRNFGHEFASTAGFDNCSGDVVILIDADLQDPPEIIADMIKKWEQGYKVVYARRKTREGESWFKQVSSWLFYRLLDKLSEIKVPLDTGDFRLMDKSVINSVNLCREKNRFIRGLVAWVGFEQTDIQYERSARYAGDTKYSFWKLIILSIDAILGFSDLPLHLVSIFGIFITFFSMFIALLVILHKLFFGLEIPGYALMAAGMFSFFGFVTFLLGLIGVYLGRMYKQLQNRPLYIIKEYKGLYIKDNYGKISV